MALRLTQRTIRALTPGSIVWDHTIPGFGARRLESGVITYHLKYRTAEGRQRWYTIGRHGAPWTADSARAAALRLLGEITGASTSGVKSDPAARKEATRSAVTVAKLCDVYLAAVESGQLLTKRGTSKTAATLRSDRTRIGRHIKPLLGDRLVAAVTREDIESFQNAVTAGNTSARKGTGRGQATRSLGLLGAIFDFAVKRHMRPDNPCRGVRRAADGRRERRLSDSEYGILGNVLRQAETAGIWPSAIAGVRFLALTGWRKGEAEALRWPEVALPRRTATLAQTKTGRSLRPLASAACEVLAAAPGDALVFANPGGGPLDLGDALRRVAALDGLPADISCHTLRHSFASVAADLGYNEPTIAAMIGHKGRSTTSRYTHVADEVLLAAADAVANRIVTLMAL
jgi:integrase